ncbi:MAG: hypothetical protein IJB59_01125 [Oscillospiraceae bacterium]|nr:hypothetical protein [Oscillospiraceae bacterium]
MPDDLDKNNILLSPLAKCSCQEIVDTKNIIVLEAQFGPVLNWAFIALGSRRSPVIERMYILIQDQIDSEMLSTIPKNRAATEIFCVLRFWETFQ